MSVSMQRPSDHDEAIDRHLGPLDDALYGYAGSPGQGAYVEIWLRVNEDCVEAAAFTARGCESCAAVSKVLCDMAEGSRLRDLKEITPRRILQRTGCLPDGEYPYARLPYNALKRALARGQEEYVAPMIVHRSIEIGELCAKLGVETLDVFGSAARGYDFDPATSDYDFIATFTSEAQSRVGRSYFALQYGLKDILQKKVDLALDDHERMPDFTETLAIERKPVYRSPSVSVLQGRIR